MTFVLSIIAAPPSGGDITTADGNVAIETIVEMMTTRSPPGYKTQVARATYVRDIAVTLRELRARGEVPDIIQIIGHGSAGRLELGNYWSRTQVDPRLGPAVLDSNPDSYGMLRDVIAAPTRVFLLGCSVGSGTPAGYVASGKALLFVIEDMTGADVYAADGNVYPELFEDGFLYRGPLVTSSGKPANPAAVALTRSPPLPAGAGVGFATTAVRPVPQLTSLVSAPAFGLTSELNARIPVDANFFSNYVVAQPQPGRLLAMAELVFAARNYKRVEAICCLRYLRAETEDGTVYFEPPPSVTPRGVPLESSPGDPLPSARPTLDLLRSAALDASGI